MSKKGSRSEKMHPTKRMVLKYARQGWSSIRIAEKIGCTKRNVNRHKCDLKIQRYDLSIDDELPESDPYMDAGTVRVHAGHYTLPILRMTPSYEKRWKQKVQRLRSYTVKYHTQSVEIQETTGHYGHTLEEAEQKSFSHLFRTIRRIEDHAKISLWKIGSQFTCHNRHIAYPNHPFALEASERDIPIKVKGKDGQVWLAVDRSTGSPELEFQHASRSTEDARRLSDAFFNYIRDSKSLTLAQIQDLAIRANVVQTIWMERQMRSMYNDATYNDGHKPFYVG